MSGECYDGECAGLAHIFSISFGVHTFRNWLFITAGQARSNGDLVRRFIVRCRDHDHRAVGIPADDKP